MPRPVWSRVARTPSPRRWCDRRRAPCTATATAKPTTVPPATVPASPSSPSTATIALNAPDLAANHATWSVSVRGTRSKVRRAGGDLAVVDRARIASASLAIASRMISVGHGRPMVIAGLAPAGSPWWEHHPWRYTPASVRGSATLRITALLAQSVEHSHGKAGVVGSIPTEGSATNGRSDSLGPPLAA